MSQFIVQKVSGNIYKGCSINPWLLERWCCYRKYVTTLREYHLISVRIQSFKSVRWLENFLQPVEFSFSFLKQKTSLACLLNFIFYEKNQSKKRNKSSQHIIRSLLHRMAWFQRGSLNFVAAVLAQVLLSVLAVQKRWLLKKWSIKSMTSSIESAWD